MPYISPARLRRSYAAKGTTLRRPVNVKSLYVEAEREGGTRSWSDVDGSTGFIIKGACHRPHQEMQQFLQRNMMNKPRMDVNIPQSGFRAVSLKSGPDLKEALAWLTEEYDAEFDKTTDEQDDGGRRPQVVSFNLMLEKSKNGVFNTPRAFVLVSQRRGLLIRNVDIRDGPISREVVASLNQYLKDYFVVSSTASCTLAKLSTLGLLTSIYSVAAMPDAFAPSKIRSRLREFFNNPQCHSAYADFIIDTCFVEYEDGKARPTPKEQLALIRGFQDCVYFMINFSMTTGHAYLRTSIGRTSGQLKRGTKRPASTEITETAMSRLQVVDDNLRSNPSKQARTINNTPTPSSLLSSAPSATSSAHETPMCDTMMSSVIKRHELPKPSIMERLEEVLSNPADVTVQETGGDDGWDKPTPGSPQKAGFNNGWDTPDPSGAQGAGDDGGWDAPMLPGGDHCVSGVFCLARPASYSSEWQNIIKIADQVTLTTLTSEDPCAIDFDKKGCKIVTVKVPNE
jgi:hypothetical protein